MSATTFDYYALYYLNQWLEYDRTFFCGLQNPDKAIRLTTLQEAVKFYRVIRNVELKYEQDNGEQLPRLGLVLDIVDTLELDFFQNDVDTLEKLTKKIKSVEGKISEKYGGESFISLTTKVLWLKYRHPILIYDSNAQESLGTRNGDLLEYYQKWNSEFQNCHGLIKMACQKLPDVSRYCVNPEIGTPDYIRKTSEELWFQERVFDMYLWRRK